MHIFAKFLLKKYEKFGNPVLYPLHTMLEGEELLFYRTQYSYEEK